MRALLLALSLALCATHATMAKTSSDDLVETLEEGLITILAKRLLAENKKMTRQASATSSQDCLASAQDCSKDGSMGGDHAKCGGGCKEYVHCYDHDEITKDHKWMVDAGYPAGFDGTCRGKESAFDLADLKCVSPDVVTNEHCTKPAPTPPTPGAPDLSATGCLTDGDDCAEDGSMEGKHWKCGTDCGKYIKCLNANQIKNWGIGNGVTQMCNPRSAASMFSIKHKKCVKPEDEPDHPCLA